MLLTYMPFTLEEVRTAFPEAEVSDFGVLLKVTEHCEVHLMPAITNLRIVEVDPARSFSHKRGWCYERRYGYLRVFEAAARWDGAPDTEPSGWRRSIPDHRYDGEKKEGVRQQ